MAGYNSNEKQEITRKNSYYYYSTWGELGDLCQLWFILLHFILTATKGSFMSYLRLSTKKLGQSGQMKIAVAILALVLPTICSAKTVQIEFTKFDTFSIEVVHIDAGDTVEWLPKNGGHNVEFITGPHITALPKNSKMDEFHSVVFKATGVYLYGCTPHLNMGMLGLVVVGDDLHNLEKLYDVKLSRIAKSVLEDLIKITKSQSE